MSRRLRRIAIETGVAGLLTASVACAVGPTYRRPDVPAPPAFAEGLPSGWKDAQPSASGWKDAHPSDGAVRSAWWEVFGDAGLNALEQRVSISNQNVLAAEAQLRAARAAVQIAGAGRFPEVSLAPTVTQTGAGGPAVNQSLVVLPVDVTWQVDVWGGIRRSVAANKASAQASAAQLGNARLLYQAELATDYFQRQGLDASRRLLEDAVASYERYLQLTQDRFEGGVASMGDVTLAETQLESARAQLSDLGVEQAQLDHAIAVLTGAPPANLSLPAMLPATPTPVPDVPVGIPSELLERRPDVAAAEREMAAANAQIGVAKSAFYPALTLTAAGSSRTAVVADLLTMPTRFWSVGAELAATLFDAGRRRAQVTAAEATYDATVANYRQTVLTGFQQVEDTLAALRVLADEAAIVDRAVDAAKRSLEISTTQYRGGLTNYLQVITAQTNVLQNERTAADILTRRQVASVSLIQALGGGWDASQ
jgi:NodT family efflux transporter outer membrane factor (OMF) lipoprotein